MLNDTPHILVDLDCTLAYYETWGGPEDIGEPIPAMLEKVKEWIRQGIEVRIFTARVAVDDELHYMNVVTAIQSWCLKHIGKILIVTNEKTLATLAIYDDRAYGVMANTGAIVGENEKTFKVLV